MVRSFFRKIELNKDEYVDGFNDGVQQFIDRVRKRAQEKLKEMRESGELKDEDIQYVEVEEGEKVLGPGGLDPVEVFETLPPAWQEAFSSREPGKLQLALQEADPEEAQYHMKRCIDSGFCYLFVWLSPVFVWVSLGQFIGAQVSFVLCICFRCALYVFVVLCLCMISNILTIQTATPPFLWTKVCGFRAVKILMNNGSKGCPNLSGASPARLL